MSVAVAQAPGRLDVMGGIADYSGSLVLELPLTKATEVSAQWTHDRLLTIHSTAGGDDVAIPLEHLVVSQYDEARARFSQDPDTRWAAYVAGVVVVLIRKRGLSLERGIDLSIRSHVPAGKGVASSAALEVATMRAVCMLTGLEIDARDMAILCQMAENLVVGAPCGVMDQMTAACGERDRLLALLCQPATILGHVSIPHGLALWGIDSDIRHAVTGSDYGAVRTGAFMGYRILADHLGFGVKHVAEGRVAIEDERWGGYLANVGTTEWMQRLRHHVPEEMDGAEFLHRYQGITDSVTRVDPARQYAVRQPTEHPIFEHARVQEYLRILESHARTEAERERLGQLMFESHESYSACGLGSDGTDRIVELANAMGPEHGIYGAKITGGGSGGVVAVLAREGAHGVVDAIAERYAAETGRTARVIR